MRTSRIVDGARRIFLFLVVAIVPAFYLSFIFTRAVNIPIGDDYTILAWVNGFHAISSVSGKLASIASFHNEHRIVVTRVISLLVQYFSGSLDFRLLLLISNATLVVAVFQLGYALGFRDNMFAWATLLLLSLQPQFYKLMFYPMSSLQVAFALLFSICYLRSILDRAHFAITVLWYFLAILSAGSGLFLVFLGGLLLFFQKRIRECFLHVIIALLSACLYFYGFHAGEAGRLDYLFTHPVSAISFFLQLLGNISCPAITLLSLPTYVEFLPLVLGSVLAGYFAFHCKLTVRAIRTQSGDVYIREFAVLSYLVLMIILIVFGRAKIYQSDLISAALDGRYTLYGMLFTAVSAISAVRIVQVRGCSITRIKMVILALAIVVNVGMFTASFVKSSGEARTRLEAMRLFVSNGVGTGLTTWAVPRDYAVRELKLAIANGLYCPP